MKQRLKKQDVDFTQIKNKVLSDNKLSFNAKGVYGYIYSKPDDWQFSVKRIALDSNGKHYLVKSAIKELEEQGYLQREKQSSGRMLYYINYDKKANVDETKGGSNLPISNIVVNSNKEINTSAKAVLKKKKIPSSSKSAFKEKEKKENLTPKDNVTEFKKYEKDKQRHIHLIGRYFTIKQKLNQLKPFPTRTALKKEFARQLKPARELADYPDERIRLAVCRANKMTSEWTLLTVCKYINK